MKLKLNKKKLKNLSNGIKTLPMDLSTQIAGGRRGTTADNNTADCSLSCITDTF